MKVIIAEKPSVARDIAAVWGIKECHAGYISGKGCAVTWAFGHLVTLLEPGDYTPEMKRWSMSTLPFIPEEFKLKLIGNKGVKEQFNIICGLLKEAEQVICATDAGREGELIFRYLLHLSGYQDKPFKRLWLNSLTPEAIKEAFSTLKEGHEYDPLYAAARCRSEADWIVGLNATRCFTVCFGSAGGGDRVLWSVGRVQTPVLAMIVDRDDEIMNFEPKAFWELTTKYREVTFKYTGKRFDEPEKAQVLLDKITGEPLVITGIKATKKIEKPPQLYDLTSLQRDMNKREGLSAADTLKFAQELYEKKFVTYPRTDSRYLSKDMESRVPQVLEQLRKQCPALIEPLDLKKLPFTKRIVDDKKVTDHHAIIPTGMVPSGLSDRAKKVYVAITKQFIAAFYPDCKKEITTIDGASKGVAFRAKGTRVVSAGWTALFPKKKDNKNEDQALPAFEKGESGPHEPSVREGKTKPPKHFSENTLLAAMESAGKMVDDEALREALKQRGIGTPATRAAIIETLLRRHYIERKKKQVLATDMGRFLVSIITDDLLKSPEMTGEWEEKLKKIEQGHLSADQFMGEIGTYAQAFIQDTKGFVVDRSRWGNCPRCGGEVIAGRKGGIGCSRWKEGCHFVLWRDYHGVQLNDSQVCELIQRNILLTPVTLPEEGRVVLRMDKRGNLMHLACPQRDQQKQG